MFVATLLLLMGAAVLPSNVKAGSTGSRNPGHGASRLEDKDGNSGVNASRKTSFFGECKCGPSGTISKVDIFHDNSREKTTIFTCSGCSGTHVPTTSLTETVQDHVVTFFKNLLSNFKNVTVYRCSCTAVNTTRVSTASRETTVHLTGSPKSTSSDSQKPPSTIKAILSPSASSTQPPATTKNIPSTTLSSTKPPTTTNTIPSNTISSSQPRTTTKAIPSTAISSTQPPTTTKVILSTTLSSTQLPTTTKTIPSTTLSSPQPPTTTKATPSTTISSTQPPTTTKTIPSTTISSTQLPTTTKAIPSTTISSTQLPTTTQAIPSTTVSEVTDTTSAMYSLTYPLE